MTRRILSAGVLGGGALMLWTSVMNVGFGFTVRTQMNRVSDPKAVHALLAAQIARPGAYLVNPPPAPGSGVPAAGPVFAVHYSGVGHEAAGALSLGELAIALAAAILVAGLLSVTSGRILSRYATRVLFVGAIGLLLAVFGDLPRFGIGGYPAGTALLLAANHLGSWIFAGLVMAWALRVPRTAVAGA